MKQLMRDIAVVLIEVAGLAALSYGSWLAWKPAGYIVPGAVIFALSVLADIRSRRGSGKEVR